jgi:hypothetical protein
MRIPSRRRLLWSAVVLLVGLLAVDVLLFSNGFTLWNRVTLDKAAKLTPGMTKQEIWQIFGEPSRYLYVSEELRLAGGPPWYTAVWEGKDPEGRDFELQISFGSDGRSGNWVTLPTGNPTWADRVIRWMGF